MENQIPEAESSGSSVGIQDNQVLPVIVNMASSGGGNGNSHRERVPNGEGPWLLVREEVAVWLKITSLDVAKRAFQLASSFSGTKGILARKWVLANEQVAETDLGVNELMKYLEEKTTGEARWDRFAEFGKFLDIRKAKGESMDSCLDGGLDSGRVWN